MYVAEIPRFAQDDVNATTSRGSGLTTPGLRPRSKQRHAQPNCRFAVIVILRRACEPRDLTSTGEIPRFAQDDRYVGEIPRFAQDEAGYGALGAALRSLVVPPRDDTSALKQFVVPPRDDTSAPRSLVVPPRD